MKLDTEKRKKLLLTKIDRLCDARVHNELVPLRGDPKDGPEAEEALRRAVESTRAHVDDLFRVIDELEQEVLNKSAELTAVAARVEEQATVLGEAYVIAGCLLVDTGLFDTPRGDGLLTNLEAGKLIHADLLPWDSVDENAIGKIDEGEDGKFVEFIPDRDLPNGALVYLAPPDPANVRDEPSIPSLVWVLEQFMDAVGGPPERNCSCHISPPCNDCSDNSALRTAWEDAQAFLAKARA